jgi:hypothetical protein
MVTRMDDERTVGQIRITRILLCGMEVGDKDSGTPHWAVRDQPARRKLSMKIIEAEQLHMEQ